MFTIMMYAATGDKPVLGYNADSASKISKPEDATELATYAIAHTIYKDLEKTYKGVFNIMIHEVLPTNMFKIEKDGRKMPNPYTLREIMNLFIGWRKVRGRVHGPVDVTILPCPGYPRITLTKVRDFGVVEGVANDGSVWFIDPLGPNFSDSPSLKKSTK